MRGCQRQSTPGRSSPKEQILDSTVNMLSLCVLAAALVVVFAYTAQAQGYTFHPRHNHHQSASTKPQNPLNNHPHHP